MSMFPWGRCPWGDERHDWPLVRKDPFEELNRVSRQMDQLMRQFGVSPYWSEPRGMDVAMAGSSVVNDDSKFEISLDVKHFKPEELDVKTTDNQLIIRGKHEESKDEHGFVKREFTRSYWLPKGVKPEAFKSTLTPDGRLTITAPKKAVEGGAGEHKIPIEAPPK